MLPTLHKSPYELHLPCLPIGQDCRRVGLPRSRAVSAAAISSTAVELTSSGLSSHGEAFPQVADSLISAPVSPAVGALGAVGVLGAALFVSGPQRRRATQMEGSGGNEKEAVRGYFNNVGFERWTKIYGETDDVNKVQLDIRTGHAQTVDVVLNWLGNDLSGTTICDAGCGTGSLSIPLALRGASVSASDISQAMVREAERRYNAQLTMSGSPRPAAAPQFQATDLESVTGRFNTVCCIDVLIHYPQEQVDRMVAHLVSLAEDRVLLSFAPSTPYYEVLKRVGEFFPKGSQATRAYLHKEAAVQKAFEAAGWKVVRKHLTATNFYFSLLVEAVKA